MTSPASSSDSTSFGLLDERIQRWIWESGWTELKDAQERAIPVVLEGRRDVIIAAATASGKTEAAFFPILTRILAEPEPISAVYISPLKALINDQWGRLERLCERLEIPVVPWHGEISASLKRKFLKDPRGCVLITPESLEGLLMREGHALIRLFGGLRFVVVDELHAFLDSDRGKQLQSLMNRIDVALGRRIPRIGLSATLGKMELAAEFLRPDSGGEVEVIESKSSGQELKVIVKGYYNLEPKLSEEEIAAKTDAGEHVTLEDTLPAGVVAIGEHLFKVLRGTNNLVFPNSRRQVELYSDLLRRACEKQGIANEFWPHHGSLSKAIRDDAERELKKGDRPATAIATTTLELGIDIGAVKSIAQIGPAPSVASLRQRLGRSGRRRGEPAILRCYCLEDPLLVDSTLSDRLREGLVHTVAQVRLLTASWFEPPRRQSMHLSTFVQQILSVIAQYGGVTAGQAWSLLCTSGVFPEITKEEFVLLLRALGEKRILMQDSRGVLLHGEVGEKIVNHYSFYAAFMAGVEFRVMCAGRQLGSLPLDRPIAADSYLIFAGRRWKVVGCYPEEKLIDVVPAEAGKLPLFDGMGGKVHDNVRMEMREVLRRTDPIAFLDPTALSQVAEARENYDRLGLDDESIVAAGGHVHVFTWKGDWVNDTLSLMLSSRGLRSSNEGIAIAIYGSPADRVHDALLDIGQEPPLQPEELAAGVRNKYRGKYDGLLPENLLNKNFASSEIEIEGAVATAKSLTANLSGPSRFSR